jgi:hypothetical protein
VSKIFCIGLNKTATTTLHEALTTLGFRSLHWKAGRDDEPADHAVFRAQEEGLPLLTYIAGYDAYSDIWPLIHNFDVLDEQYPGSRFILTTRDLDAWLESRTRHVERDPAGTAREVDHEDWRRRFELHHRRVEEHFAGRSDLLVLDIPSDPSWGRLCAFLDRPVPDTPFPWANRRPAASRGR